MIPASTLTRYQGSDLQVCCVCAQRGDSTPKPILFFFKNAASYFEYLCLDCAIADQATPDSAELPPPEKSGGENPTVDQPPALDNADLQALHDRNKALTAKVRELKEQNEALSNDLLRTRELQSRLSQLEAENEQLRLTQSTPSPATQNCFSGFFHHFDRNAYIFIYWDCRSQEEASTLAMLNLYEESYGLLECMNWESPEILAVCDRHQFAASKAVPFKDSPYSPQFVYEVLLAHYPQLLKDYEGYQAQSAQNPNDADLIDTIESLTNHVLAIQQLLPLLKSICGFVGSAD